MEVRKPTLNVGSIFWHHSRSKAWGKRFFLLPACVIPQRRVYLLHHCCHPASQASSITSEPSFCSLPIGGESQQLCTNPSGLQYQIGKAEASSLDVGLCEDYETTDSQVLHCGTIQTVLCKPIKQISFYYILIPLPCISRKLGLAQLTRKTKIRKEPQYGSGRQKCHHSKRTGKFCLASSQSTESHLETSGYQGASRESRGRYCLNGGTN